jgi:hypothetical protein
MIKSKILSLICASIAVLALTGCATVSLEQAVYTHNTLQAISGLTHTGLRAELLQGIHYAR